MEDPPGRSDDFSTVSTWRAALGCRCPRCGRGRLFAGLLSVRQACEVCGLDLSAQDAGDGPAVFVIFFLGLIVVGLIGFLFEKYANGLEPGERASNDARRDVREKAS